MAEQRRFKAINFDLDTASLRNLFGEEGRRKAYADVGRFLAKNNFEHRQGSGYRSTVAMSDLDVADIIVEMYMALSWLPECVQKFDVTNIGRNYDMDALARNRIAVSETPRKKRHFDFDLDR
jgi:virulence-associated protein VapD